MIEVRDLMYGNLIETKDGIVEVGKIHRDSVADKWGGIYFDDEIEGIEVTTELLEKIGFEERILGKGVNGGEDWVDYIFRPESYKLEVCDHGGYVCDKKWHVHIDNAEFESLGGGYFTYLHELMNLVRVISGFEFKITKDMLYD